MGLEDDLDVSEKTEVSISVFGPGVIEICALSGLHAELNGSFLPSGTKYRSHIRWTA